MGVAVISSTCGALPLLVSASRSATPNRCCSSTTARRRSSNATASWTSACVPTTMRPRVRPSSVAREWRTEQLERLATLGRAERSGQQRHVVAERLEQPAQRLGVLTGQQVGRREQCALVSGVGREGQARAPRRRSCPNQRRPGAGASSAGRRQVGADVVERAQLVVGQVHLGVVGAGVACQPRRRAICSPITASTAAIAVASARR